MLGPTGIGVLWARDELLEAMPPFLGGGEMIRDVRLDGFTPNDLPWKFEAGTPPIAEAVGLGAAVDYLDALGMDAVRAHEIDAHRLRPAHASPSASATTSRIYGPPDPTQRGGVISLRLHGTSTPTTCPRSSTSTACASGPATTAPSR